MKSKRSGYLQKGTQGNKKNPAGSSPRTVLTVELAEKQKDESQCDGVCSIAWKPAVVSR